MAASTRLQFFKATATAAVGQKRERDTKDETENDGAQTIAPRQRFAVSEDSEDFDAQETDKKNDDQRNDQRSGQTTTAMRAKTAKMAKTMVIPNWKIRRTMKTTVTRKFRNRETRPWPNATSASVRSWAMFMGLVKKTPTLAPKRHAKREHFALLSFVAVVTPDGSPTTA